MQTCRKSVMSIMSDVMPLLPISKKNDNSEGSVQNTTTVRKQRDVGSVVRHWISLFFFH